MAIKVLPLKSKTDYDSVLVTTLMERFKVQAEAQ